MTRIDSDNQLWELFDNGAAIFRFDPTEGDYVRLQWENDVALFNNLGHNLYH